MTSWQGFAKDAALASLSKSRSKRRAQHVQLLTQLGKVVIIAPHPDDETLGCGGLISACVDLDLPLHIFSVTNGEGSHPRSIQWNEKRLAKLRQTEQQLALRALGLNSPEITRFNLPDGRVGQQSSTVLSKVRCQIMKVVNQVSKVSCFVTCPDDDHPDHRACAALIDPLRLSNSDCGMYYYSIWPTENLGMGRSAKSKLEKLVNETPKKDEWLLDIRPALQRKSEAINCFESQLGLVITDDPEGFCMTDELLQRALSPQETYKRLV